MRRHIQGVHEKKVKCDKCPYKTGCRGSLKKHVQRVHDESKPFECNTCYKHFSSKEKLDHHFARVHELRNCEKCPYCEKQYSKLKTHIQTCNVKWQQLQGYRPTFECPKQCGKTFQTKDGIREHIKKYCQKKNSV